MTYILGSSAVLLTLLLLSGIDLALALSPLALALKVGV